MSNNRISDYHVSESQPKQHKSTQPQTNLVSKPISRRTAVAGLLGTAGVIGAWPPVAASPQVQTSCQPGSDFAAALQQSQLDYTNQGLVVKPEKGVVATFGNSFYRFDAATDTYSLCRNGVEILRGKVKSETQGAKNVFIEEIEAPGATAGTKALRLFHVAELIDRTPLRMQVTLDAGFVGEPSTFWFSTIYDVDARAFNRFALKGTAPTFDLTPFRPLGRLIRENFGSIILPPILKGPIIDEPRPDPPPPPDDRCLSCQVSAMVFCDLGTVGDAHNSMCGKLLSDCHKCLGGFPFLTFGF